MSNIAASAAKIPSQQLTELLRSANLPPLLRVGHALVQLLGNQETSLREIAAVIALDPNLSVRLLKVANSPYFGQVSPVTTVERAGIVLGLSYVKAVSLALQLTGPLRQLGAAGTDMDAFWRDSVLRACLARQLAAPDRSGGMHGEHAFLIGLTQDIGIPIIANRLGSPYIDVISQIGPFQKRLCEWEIDSLGYTHADVAAAVLEAWNLPALIREPIARHHDFGVGPACDDEIARLSLISYFVGALPFGVEADIQIVNSIPDFTQAARTLGMTPGTLARVLRCGRAEFETVAALFDDLLPLECEVEQVLCRACQCMTLVNPELFEAVFAV